MQRKKMVDENLREASFEGASKLQTERNLLLGSAGFFYRYHRRQYKPYGRTDKAQVFLKLGGTTDFVYISSP